MNVILNPDDYYAGTIGAVGGAHSVSNEPDPVDEAIRRLHEAVKEVTGKDVEPAPRQRIGFLP